MFTVSKLASPSTSIESSISTVPTNVDTPETCICLVPVVPLTVTP